MAELILNTEIDNAKLDVLRKLFKSWNLKLEIKKTAEKRVEKTNDFPFTVGIWEDYDIDGKKLREKAWKRK